MSEQSVHARLMAFAVFLVALLLPAHGLIAATECVNPGGTGGCFATIQGAVTAASAGDTINVAAGTYAELVTVSKSLTLEGAQSGIDARSSCRTGAAGESVVTGNTNAGKTSFNVTANNVTIDGFTIEDATNINVFGAAIVLGAGTSGSHVINNIIQNNIVGLILANSSAMNQTVIQKNFFLTNNQPGPASGDAIYTDQFDSGGTLTNVLIDNNRFSGNDDAGLDFSSTSPGSQSNVTISNNEFDSNFRAMLMFYLTSSQITLNNIHDSTGDSSADIRIFDGNSGLTIDCNTIVNGAGRAIRSSLAVGTDVSTNIAAHNNNISGNLVDGLEIDSGSYTGTFAADNNWWGSSTGPTIASNPGGTGQAIVDPDGVVDYTPFLTTPATCTNIAITAGNNQVTPINTPFPTNLQVTVTDGGGAPLPGRAVTFTAPASGASGTFAGGCAEAIVITDGSGNATAPQFTANGITGTYLVPASVGSGLASVSFSLTNGPVGIDLTLTKNNNVAGTTAGAWTWDLTVANAGGASATFVTSDILLQDNLPDTGVSYTSPVVSNATNISGAGTISCAIDGSSNLTCSASGGSVTIGGLGHFDVSFTATPTVTGTFVNPRAGGTATVDPDGDVGETNEGNNSATDTVTVTGTHLVVTKVGSPHPVAADTNITYTITLTNSGPAAAQNVVVTDPTPPNTTFVSATVSSGTGWSTTTPSVGGTGNVVFSKATVANGETATFQIVLHVNANASGSISNTATATSTTPDPAPAGRAATDTAAIAAVPVVPVPASGPLALAITAWLLALVAAIALRKH